jgi:dihydroxyacetone kinase DhaKLM complex PTS-EIIA-like component DhaM
MTVSLVIVSHSVRLAEGVAELARPLAIPFSYMLKGKMLRKPLKHWQNW